jgi:hypothetical protein
MGRMHLRSIMNKKQGKTPAGAPSGGLTDDILPEGTHGEKEKAKVPWLMANNHDFDQTMLSVRILKRTEFPLINRQVAILFHWNSLALNFCHVSSPCPGGSS